MRKDWSLRIASEIRQSHLFQRCPADAVAFPGLSSINYKDGGQATLLRRMASLTPVKPGEPPLDGLPPIVLRVLRAAIEQCRNDLIRNTAFGQRQSRLKRTKVSLTGRVIDSFLSTLFPL